MRTIAVAASAVLAAVLLSACDGGTTEPGDSLPATFDILYESFENPQSQQIEIFVLRDGSAERERIFPEFQLNGQPSVTGNATRMALVAPGIGEDFSDIFVSNTDGSGRTRVPLSAGDESSPSLSPDGSKLVYVKRRADNRADLYSANVDGSNEVPLTVSIPEIEIAHQSPRWSPDGTRIAFAAGVPGQLHIWVMNANGSNLAQLTNASITDTDISWSPDGKRLVFARTATPALSDLVILDIASRQEHPMGLAGSNRFPSWSPDGTRIVFSASVPGAGDTELFTIRPDGSALTRLTDNDVNDRRPVWRKR
jgi:Tol biopolymer transport system component